jgi:hypothetical protein
MELISISTIQISRGWDPTVMVRDYLLGLPLKFMRCVAGFPKEPGQYHLPRATTEPPEGRSSRLWKSGGDVSTPGRPGRDAGLREAWTTTIRLASRSCPSWSSSGSSYCRTSRSCSWTTHSSPSSPCPSSGDKSGSTSRPSYARHTGATRSHGVSYWSASCRSSARPCAPASGPRSGGPRPRSSGSRP